MFFPSASSTSTSSSSSSSHSGARSRFIEERAKEGTGLNRLRSRRKERKVFKVGKMWFGASRRKGELARHLSTCQTIQFEQFHVISTWLQLMLFHIGWILACPPDTCIQSIQSYMSYTKNWCSPTWYMHTNQSYMSYTKNWCRRSYYNHRIHTARRDINMWYLQP